MSVIATVFHPDGTQIVHGKRRKPLVFERLDAFRAFNSARRAWWPKDRTSRSETGPEWGNPPIGAEIRLNGQPWLRWELADVEDEAGEIVDVVEQWVDIAQRVRDEKKAARIAAAKAAQAARRAAAAAESASGTEDPPVIAPPKDAGGISEAELVGGRATVGDATRHIAGGPAAPVIKTPRRRE